MTEHRWNDEHGPDELYDKFTVIQNSTSTKLGEDGEFVFVLRPERDEAAFEAMWQYAQEVRYRSPNLADQICDKLEKIAEEQ